MATESNQRTIKELADQSHRRGIEAYGEAGFAKLCLHFEKQIPPGGSEEDRLVTVLSILATASDPKICNWRACGWMGADIAPRIWPLCWLSWILSGSTNQEQGLISGRRRVDQRDAAGRLVSYWQYAQESATGTGWPKLD